MLALKAQHLGVEVGRQLTAEYNEDVLETRDNEEPWTVITNVEK